MTEITNKIYYVGVNDRNKHRCEYCPYAALCKS